MGMGVDVRNAIARRAAEEITQGMVVNLGIGIPSLVSNFLPDDMKVMFHAENGILGMGEAPKKGTEDPALCNAAGWPVSINNGASYFDSSEAFAMIRRGHLDITILGALEVSETGDLANWIVPGKRVPGIGGAMELAQKAKKVIVLMSHVNKYGEPKILKACNLPLTSANCVDMIITDMAVMEIREQGIVVTEVMEPYTPEDIQQHTEATLIFEEELKTMS
ncbi:3-oxoacid CoA-transferase subunit B [Bacillus tianshenii]|nr:3-oxoacid CoA-transferase subunit B [Bacillus tianshenii]